jgi:hypothetical protein
MATGIVTEVPQWHLPAAWTRTKSNIESRIDIV